MDVSPTLSMRAGDLVAVADAPGPAWITLVGQVWEAGAALMPVDTRLTAAEQQRLLERARPTVVIRGADLRRINDEGIAGDVAVVVATSGSTGEPRLVELNRGAVTAAVVASAERLEGHAGDPWLCCIPVAHIGGLLVLLRHVILGAPLTIHASFDPAAVCAAADARFTSLVPAQLRRLLDGGCELAQYRALLVGGAALAADVASLAAERTRVVATYGLTESCGGVVYDGRPLSGVEVRVADDGEIQLRGSTLMRGYRFDESATASAFTGDGWLRTSDAGTLDADGRLHVHGRRDEAITTGGETVWPLEVEAALSEHPQVAEVAVSARDDAAWGERVVAFVVPRDPAHAPTLDSLRGFAAERIARYKAPRELVIVASLDRTSLGKLRRDRLPPPDRTAVF